MQKPELIPVVRMHDPAFAGVDFQSLKRYATTRDPEDLPKVDGLAAEPITFWFRRLTRSQVFDYVQRVTIDEQRFARAFAAGVVRISGGRFGEAWEPQHVSDPQRVSMTDEEMEEAQLAPADIEDIGQVVYLRSCSPFDCTPRYPPRLSSLAVWEGNARLFAERSRTGAEKSNEQRKGG